MQLYRHGGAEGRVSRGLACKAWGLGVLGGGRGGGVVKAGEVSCRRTMGTFICGPHLMLHVRSASHLIKALNHQSMKASPMQM